MEALFREPLSDTVRATLLSAGQRIEALPDRSPQGWWVGRDQPDPEQTRSSLVSTTLTAWQGQDDWLEFDVELCRLFNFERGGLSG